MISLNLNRRYLNESQRAMVAANIANIGKGGYQSKTANLWFCQPEAAEKLNASECSVNTTKSNRLNPVFWGVISVIAHRPFHLRQCQSLGRTIEMFLKLNYINSGLISQIVLEMVDS